MVEFFQAVRVLEQLDVNQKIIHFIASHSIQETVNAGTFEQYALAKATELLEKFGSAVMVGGTGLYIKAFVEGMDQIPAIDPAIRNQIQQDLA